MSSCSSWKQKVCNMHSFTLISVSVWHRKSMKTACFEFFFTTCRRNIRVQRYMTLCRNVVVIGIRNNRTALRNKWLYSIMSRVVDSHLGEQGSRSGLSIFKRSIFYGSVTETLVAHHKFIVLLPIKGVW